MINYELSREVKRQIHKEKERFFAIVEISLRELNRRRLAKFKRIVEECPDSDCAGAVMPFYREVNHHTDKVLNEMADQIPECIRSESFKSPEKVELLRCFGIF